MTKENLQQLIGVHNLLFGLSVTGDAIVPLAQALVTLSGVIGAEAEAFQAGITAPDDANRQEEVSD